MFRKMPLVLLGSIISVIFLDSFIPIEAKRAGYALGLSAKGLIIFILPVLIFMLLFKTLARLSRDGSKMILWILGGVCISNFISTMISGQIGNFLYGSSLSIDLPKGIQMLTPTWTLTLPKLIANDHAMFLAILLGLLSSYLFPRWGNRISAYFDTFSQYILKYLSCLIPFFILGFAIKLTHDGVLKNIIQDYSFILCLVIVSLAVYISFIYLVANKLKPKQSMHSAKNMIPAAMAGFCSMSSAAAMPLTLIGTEKNAPGCPLTRLTIPTTVNIHLIGDCFAIPIFAFAVMKNFHVAPPTLWAYGLFALYFVMAKFSVAAIPGGGILVMLPILESQLGFTGEMSSLITALYVLFDPVITCANVFGNGAFALALRKFYHRKKEIRPIEIRK